MTERWRERLGALGRVEPEGGRLRDLASGGPRHPEPPRGGGSRVVAAVVAAAVAVSALGFLAWGLRDDTTGRTPSGDRVESALDPEAICEVPTYDPDVALLVGQPEREVPLADLEGPGQPATDLEGPGAEAFRAYLATPGARNFPADGWRRVTTDTDEVLFASPHEPDGWWLAGFTPQPDGDWRRTEEEIVEQAQTRAQRGQGLSLTWDGDLVVDEGRWNVPLRLVNGREDAWSDEGSLLWGIPHVFEAETGVEVAAPLPTSGWSGDGYELGPGDALEVPVALGGALPALEPGAYEVVACVPDLGLASPPVEATVDDTGVVTGVRVLTYRFEGASMLALSGRGTLSVEGGCLATVTADQVVYPVWPDGHVVVRRDGREVLIDPVGQDVAALGDEVTLGGGFVPGRLLDDIVTGGLPPSCRTSGEGYFITSGLAEG
jgi:hypothetical protein